MGRANKVAVFGLDGVPFPLLESLFSAGSMPRLAEVAKSGSFVKMEGTVPAISSVAWTSFMTGTDPGEHGIFGFTDVRDGEIALKLPSFDDIRTPVMWQRIPERRSLVVNLPFTYPARALNGVLIAGFVAPVFERAVYPPSLLGWLKSMKYRTDVDSVGARTDRGALFRDLFDTLNVHERVMLSLLQTKPWDLFIGVVTGTDRLHHFLFDAYDDPEHPFHRDFISYYERVDVFIGRLLDRLGSDVRLIFLSDHGFTGLKHEVFLNHILRTLGYLSLSTPNPSSVADVHPRSLAFAMDPTRIYLNSRERFAKGFLGESEAEEVRARLRSDLQRLRLIDVGIRDSPSVNAEEPLFEKVCFREDVYRGSAVQSAPDIVVIPRRGYNVKAAFDVPVSNRKDIFSGMHTEDDAFLIVDDPTLADRLAEPKISDVLGLVLEVLE